MKKVILSIVLFLFLTAPAIAAWTTSVTFDGSYTWKDNTQMIVFKITATSDASGSGDVTLSSALETTYGADTGKFYHTMMKGGALYAVEYVPGSVTPTSEGTITIDTANGTILFSEAVSTANTGQFFSGDVDATIFPPLTDFIFACSTLANAKTATFYIWILK